MIYMIPSAAIAEISSLEQKTIADILNFNSSLASRQKAAKAWASLRGVPQQKDSVVRAVNVAIIASEEGYNSQSIWERNIVLAVDALLSENDVTDLVSRRLLNVPVNEFADEVRSLARIIKPSMRRRVEKTMAELVKRDPETYEVPVAWAEAHLGYIVRYAYLEIKKAAENRVKNSCADLLKTNR